MGIINALILLLSPIIAVVALLVILGVIVIIRSRRQARLNDQYRQSAYSAYNVRR